jgi:hypothetical protein
MIKLLPDWRDILVHAWSVWAAWALIALGAIEVLFALVGDPIFGPVLSAAIKGVIAALLILLRLVTQKQFEKALGVEDESQ